MLCNVLRLGGFALLAQACGGGEVSINLCGPGTEVRDGVCVPLSGSVVATAATGVGGGGVGGGGRGVGGGGGESPSSVGVGGAGGDVVPPSTTASPPGSAALCPANVPAKVTLKSNELATIFYTTDGSEPTTASPGGVNQVIVDGPLSTLKFFAVDAAGNAEPVKTEVYTVDATAPAAVTAVTGKLSGGNADLTWVNPADADLAGVVVVSGVGGVEAPESCVTYKAGDLVGASKVEFVGAGASVSLKSSPGVRTYRIHAIDKAGNVGPGSSSVVLSNLVDAGPQQGVLSIAKPKDAPVATVTAQPSGLGFAATAKFDAGKLLVDLEVTNSGFGFALLAPRVALEVLGQGTASDTAGTHEGKPYWRPNVASQGIDVGGKRVFRLTFDGVTGAVDPLIVSVSVDHAPVLFTGGRKGFNLFDSDTLTRLTPSIAAPYVGGGSNNNNNGQPFALLVSPDNRRLLYGSRKQGRLVETSTATGELLRSVSLARVGMLPQHSTVTGLVHSPQQGRLFAAVSHRCRNSGRVGGGVDLVALDANTLEEVGRLVVEPVGSLVRSETIHLSPNGTRLSLTTNHPRGEQGLPLRLHVIDTLTMKPIDLDATDAARTDLDITSKLPEYRTSRGAPFLAETLVMLSPRIADGRQFQLIDLANGPSLTEIPGFSGQRIAQITRGPDGKIWASSHRHNCSTEGVMRLDASGFEFFQGTSWSPGDSCSEATGPFFLPGGGRYFVIPKFGSVNRKIHLFDTAAPAMPVASIPLFNNNGDFDNRGHAAVVSPF
ncbi:MAG: chitobiase/beta-hexosaminidase C-terminal domain-containing protein [Deltaproteobacteria bacterium]|nr:chitobiase/beta-hexosaminidase C-terminal domain-containing protein [Deltaproteobacteria bacterium]